MVRPRPSMHSQESRSCSGCRLLSQQLQAQIGLLWPGAMVQLIPASKNHLDFSVMVHRSNGFTYGPAINSDCSATLTVGISTSLTKVLLPLTHNPFFNKNSATCNRSGRVSKRTLILFHFRGPGELFFLMNLKGLY